MMPTRGEISWLLSYTWPRAGADSDQRSLPRRRRRSGSAYRWRQVRVERYAEIDASGSARACTSPARTGRYALHATSLGTIAERDGEVAAGTGLESGDAGELELPGVVGEVHVAEAPPLAAEPEIMVAARYRRCVREHQRRVGATVGKFVRPAEIEAGPLIVICGSPIASSTPFVDAQIRRIHLQVGFERDVDAIEPEPRLVDEPLLKTWVSFNVPTWRCEWRVSPKPGMVLSCSVGSCRRSR